MKKANTKKTKVQINGELAKHLNNIMKEHPSGRNKYGRRLGHRPAYIDDLLEKGQTPEQIVKSWNEAHPNGTKMVVQDVIYEAHRLIEGHKA